MNAKELKEKSTEELKKMLTEARENIFNLNLEKFSRKLKNVTEISKTRHLIARILTILHEREKTGKK